MHLGDDFEECLRVVTIATRRCSFIFHIAYAAQCLGFVHTTQSTKTRAHGIFMPMKCLMNAKYPTSLIFLFIDGDIVLTV